VAQYSFGARARWAVPCKVKVYRFKQTGDYL
jgi:hypothetical protein